jgi:cytoskeletal protein CcmA (bactofilin family)
MFKKEDLLTNVNDAETIIGESVQVKGHFESNGNIIINGSLEGDIKTKGAILVGEKSKINANIEAEEMVIKGEINGNLKINGYLSIKELAKIIGDIECVQISIEKGAEINGQVTITNKKAKNNLKKESLKEDTTETEEN